MNPDSDESDRDDSDLDSDAEEPSKRKNAPSKRKSKYEGVYWNKRSQKWRGQVFNRLTGKKVYTKRYEDDAECYRKLIELRASLDAEFEPEIAKRKAANPLLDGLPRAPAKAEDAEKGKVYWRVADKTKYVPYRAVRIGIGRHYDIACETCNQFAMSNGKGERRFCKGCGGGVRCVGVAGGDGECPLGYSIQSGKGNVYEGRCVRCFCASFPDDPRAKRARGWVHAKEQAVRKVLEAAFPDYNWTFDKSFTHRTFVVGVNTRFRPDARVARGDRVIIVEVDEHSHRSYLCAKEREREESFVRQNRFKTVVMIRLNPDAYVGYDGVRRPSCFTSPTKDAETVHVHPKQKKQWEKRCKRLVDTVRTLADPKFELPPKQEDRPLLVCELFYDRVNATPEDKRIEKALRDNKAIGKRKRALREDAEAAEAKKQKQ